MRLPTRSPRYRHSPAGTPGSRLPKSYAASSMRAQATGWHWRASARPTSQEERRHERESVGAPRDWQPLELRLAPSGEKRNPLAESDETGHSVDPKGFADTPRARG